jgi:hypothetical protein
MSANTPLTEIEKQTREYAETRRILAEKIRQLEAEISDLKRRALPGIRKAAHAAGERQDLLHCLIEDNPEIFVRPRTITIDGIKVGFMKQKGEITWDDTSTVVKLIHRHHPDLIETLIKVTEMPVKAALAQLPAGDLKRLGVAVENDTDAVIIKSTDSEIDKLVEALLKEDETERDVA